MDSDQIEERDLEQYLFQKLVEKIWIQRKGALERKFTAKDLEKLESETGLSRGAIQGIFGRDITKANRNRRTDTKDSLAKILGHESFESFVKQLRGEENANHNPAYIDPDTQLYSFDFRSSIIGFYNQKHELNTIQFTGSDDLTYRFDTTNFYVSISYLNRKEIKSSNDYFTIEKEGFSYKRKKKSRNEIFSNFFSIETITEHLLLKNEHLVLIGNPGVGKSTFIRWVCSSWAKGAVSLSLIPVYVPCKLLKADTASCVEHYIHSTYLPHESYDEVSRFLREQYQTIHFLLDGYDEASSYQKQAIEDSLKRISHDGTFPPLVLLSRPYALIDSIFRKLPQLFELVGFNEENRKQYIEKYFIELGQKRKIKAFEKLIQKHVLLKDLSFNPLQLSFMVAIYASDGNGRTLEDINSIYDLYKEALHYTANYHIREKGIRRAEYFEQMMQAAPFVAEMELNLTFVYHSRGAIDLNYRHSENLSNIGLGRLEKSFEHNSWAFYLTNIHYQELLFVECYGPKLTKDALVNLMGNPLYWQVVRLFIGYLYAHGKTSIIIETLLELKSNIKSTLDHKARLYFILIGELPEDQLNSLLESQDINSVIEFYRWLYNDNLWNSLYFESLSRIYGKLNDKHKDYFNDVIRLLVNNSLSIPSIDDTDFDNEIIPGLQFPAFLSKIIETLELYRNPKLLSDLLSKFVQLIEISAYFLEEKARREEEGELYTLLFDQADVETDNSILAIISLLEKSGASDVLKPHKKLFEAYLKGYGMHSEQVAIVVSRYRPLNYFINEFKKYIAKGSYDLDVIIPATLMCIGMTGSKEYFARQDEVHGYLGQMECALKLVLTDKAGPNMEMHAIACKNLALAIAQTDNETLFDMLVWSNYYHQAGYHTADIPEEFHKECLQRFFEKRQKDGIISDNDIAELCPLVMSASNGSINFMDFYAQFLVFLTEFVNTYYQRLEDVHSKIKRNRFDIEDDPITTSLYEIPDILLYPAPILKLLDDLLNSEVRSNSFIKQSYIPFLYGCETPIYKPFYWDYLIDEYFDGHVDLTSLINVFYHNEVIFLYESNLEPLTRFWKKFSTAVLELNDAEFLKRGFAELRTIAYRTLKLHFESRGVDKNCELVRYLVPIFRNRLLIRFMDKSELLYHEKDVFSIALFPLLWIHEPHNEFKLTSKLSKQLLRSDDYRRFTLIAELAQLCSFNTELFKDCMSIDLFEALKRYCNITAKENVEDIPKLFVQALAQ